MTHFDLINVKARNGWRFRVKRKHQLFFKARLKYKTMSQKVLRTFHFTEQSPVG
jgi:hypothetical protein